MRKPLVPAKKVPSPPPQMWYTTELIMRYPSSPPGDQEEEEEEGGGYLDIVSDTNPEDVNDRQSTLSRGLFERFFNLFLYNLIKINRYM